MRRLIEPPFVIRCGIFATTLFLATGALGYSTNDIIATYAGNGGAGYTGDGGAAVSALLNAPTMLAVDASGNIYISDFGSSTIRKVSTSGIITTVAGTGTAGYNGDGILASAAQLNAPRGITFDSSGNLYVADGGNERIRKITFASGLISTVAGTGASGCNNTAANQATFSTPVGLAFDPSGDLYISEIGNRVVRKLSGGSISAFAGTCSGMNSALPWGLTTDASGNVYVTDDAENRVWKYDSSGNPTLFAGNGTFGDAGDGSLATSAGVELENPQSIAFDSAGDAFISSGTVVRVVTPDGIIHTSTGNGSAGNSGDGALATNAELDGVAGLAVNSAGRLFIADSLANVVRIVGPAAPLEVAIHPAYFTGVEAIDSADGRINCPERTCSANYVAGMAVLLNDPTPILDFLYEWTYPNCHGGSCTVYPSAFAVTSVEALFTSTYINTVFGGAVGPALHHPFALAIDSHHNFYFSELDTCTVRERTTAGAIINIAGNGICGNIGDGIQATQAELSNPKGVAVDSGGNVFIQDSGNAVIRKVTTDGILHTFATGLFTGSNSPAIALDAVGNLYMVSSATEIARVTSNGTQQPFASLSGNGANPIEGLAIAPGNTLFGYADVENEQAFVQVPLLGNPSFYNAYANPLSEAGPSGLAIDANGVIYSEDVSCAVDITTAEFGTIAYVSDSSCFDGGDGGQAVSASINGPAGMVVDANGFLYVVSSGGNAVRVIFPDAIFTGQFDF